MKRFLLCIGLVFLMSLGVNSAWAHNETIGGTVDDPTNPIEFFDFGINSITHDDESPFKGWLNIWVKNTGTEAWGDFHFEIIEADQGSIEDVSFLDADIGGFDPDYTNYTSVASGLDDWTIDNDIVGATIDLYFYSNPVLPEDVVEFSVYTDNASQVDAFGVAFYPTPVPVPAAVWLLGSGIAGLMGIHRRK